MARVLYRLFICTWIYFGLAFFAALIGGAQHQMEIYAKKGQKELENKIESRTVNSGRLIK